MEMARIFLTVLFVVVVGCGSGDHQTVVTISPRPSTVALGTSVTFTAAIQHNRVPLGVNWTLEITSAWSSAGSITVTGRCQLFTLLRQLFHRTLDKRKPN